MSVKGRRRLAADFRALGVKSSQPTRAAAKLLGAACGYAAAATSHPLSVISACIAWAMDLRLPGDW